MKALLRILALGVALAFAAFAGINIRLDLASLPDRTTLGGDTWFEVGLLSADTDNGGGGPVLEVDVAPVPEPSPSVLLAGALLCLGGAIRRRCR
jgi:hypothetical protein